MASNWAIVIGINQYRFLQPLKYAKQDAEAISEFLKHEARFDRIFLFTDDSPEIGGKPIEPFRTNLLRVLRQTFETPFMKDGDNFWFFFSGHGIRHNEQDYVMPLDGDPEDVENTGIPTQLISNYLRSCGADNVVMILDACRSGGKKSGQGIGKQTVEEARQTGVISIFSCSPDQYSYELESIGQGAFTYALMEGLGTQGRCATVERLNQYLQSQVPQLVQQIGRVRQTPYTVAEPLDRSHLILMPQHASLADIATLKNDAYRAQIKQDWDLAQRLWVRVNAAALGGDIEVIEAVQIIAVSRVMGTISQPNQLQPSIPTAQSPLFKANSSEDKQCDLDQIWQKVIDHISFQGTKVLLQQQGCLLAFDGGEARIGIISQPLFQMAKKQLSNIESAFEAVYQYKVRVNLEVATFSAPTIAVDEDNLSSKRFGANYYAQLRDLLKAGKWREADEITLDALLQLARRKKYGYLEYQHINKLPRADLHTIDTLWIKYSKGKFGISAQKRIYLAFCKKVNRTYMDYEDDAWKKFGDAVGWRVNEKWIWYSEANFDISAPQGHLPIIFPKIIEPLEQSCLIAEMSGWYGAPEDTFYTSPYCFAFLCRSDF